VAPLAPLALALPALGDVGGDRARLDRPPGVVGQRKRHGQVRARLPVAHEHGLVVDRLHLGHGAPVVCPQLLRDGREQLDALAPDELVG